MKSAEERNTEGLGQITVEAGVPGTEEAETKLDQTINHACEMMVGTRLIISAMFESRGCYQEDARARDFLIGWSYQLLELEQHLRQAWEEYTARKNGPDDLLSGN
jgi:hypothetical protein